MKQPTVQPLYPLEPEDFIAAFESAMHALGHDAPLEQREVKAVTALALDRMAAQCARPTGSLWMSLNGKLTLGAIEQYLNNSTLDPFESLLDVTMYRNDADPYDTLMTAESEARLWTFKEGFGSDTSDYLWDLFKLLQVWSPNRFFVARVRRSRAQALTNRIAAIVASYRGQIPQGHRVFSLILPPGGTYREVKCCGWQSQGGGAPLLELRSARWPASAGS
jgi:hypothetical protein